MAFSPARGLWHALALVYTLQLKSTEIDDPRQLTRTKTPIFASKKIDLYCGSDSMTSVTFEKWDFPDSICKSGDAIEIPVQSFRYDP